MLCSGMVVMFCGWGDWNCTTDFTLGQTGEEPHMASGVALHWLVWDWGLVDVGRENKG